MKILIIAPLLLSIAFAQKLPFNVVTGTSPDYAIKSMARINLYPNETTETGDRKRVFFKGSDKDLTGLASFYDNKLYFFALSTKAEVGTYAKAKAMLEHSIEKLGYGKPDAITDEHRYYDGTTKHDAFLNENYTLSAAWFDVDNPNKLVIMSIAKDVITLGTMDSYYSPKEN